jgi:hypothetical protein
LLSFLKSGYKPARFALNQIPVIFFHQTKLLARFSLQPVI